MNYRRTDLPDGGVRFDPVAAPEGFGVPTTGKPCCGLVFRGAAGLAILTYEPATRRLTLSHPASNMLTGWDWPTTAKTAGVSMAICNAIWGASVPVGGLTWDKMNQLLITLTTQ